jgi:hypothetical protein
MKKHWVVLILAAFLPLAATAQLMPRPKQECEKRCSHIEFEANPKTAQFHEKMKQLAAKKANESDPEKLKAIQEDEEDELAKRSDFVEKLCRHICRNNPES